MNPNLDLDISWIDKQENLFSTESNLHKIPMDSILCYFIYIANDSSIQKITKQSEDLTVLNENGEVGIHSERILQIIQTNRILGNGLKYKITSLSKFLVDLEHDALYDYVYNENNNPLFFKELSILEKMVIQPSLPIFHAINSLYFIFKEDVKIKKSIKSILKNERSCDVSRNTKKVRIVENTENLSDNVRKTRKNKISTSINTCE